MTTLEEKQRELDALQAAFDEYIASSRELEEELDAEYTKCQSDLAKAESRNSALSSQLAAIQPQLSSLETKLSSLATQLSSETQRRISAETRTEEAENKFRQSEGTLAAVRSTEVRKLKEENEDLFERLAFLESEAEDCRNALDAERERHREAVEELKGDLDVLKGRLAEREMEQKQSEFPRSHQGSTDTKIEGGGEVSDNAILAKELDSDLPPPPPPTPSTVAATESGTISGTISVDREDYIRTLEDGLELATEQLVDAKMKLVQTQAELDKASAKKTSGKGTATGGGSKRPSKGAKPKPRWIELFTLCNTSKRRWEC
mmetsp:Transcript_65/g.152  ORF Transcript_65/g.152 Transcript_65/m.152 type:complete len:319 (-) Transcript_65:305-1261(-)